MSVRYELEPTQFVVRIYDESHPDNYVASALVRVYGDRGWMSQITGAGFYRALEENLGEFMERLGVKTLEGYMTKSHARLLRIQLNKSGVGDVRIDHEGMCAGRMMPWVVVTTRIVWPHQAPEKFGDAFP